MPNQKITSLQEKRNALNARIQRELIRERSVERRADTRRKVLAGATVLQWATKDGEFAAKLRAELQAFLVKPADRVLFGLPVEEADKAKAS